jgi:3-phosphoshikimate 1-carboxyvinyltransferase
MMASVQTARFSPPEGRFHAERSVPGDKSLTHRALILSAMCEGRSRVAGGGTGEDVAAMRRALESLGVRFEGETVLSPGVEGWADPEGPLDLANSGTAMRLLAGALAGHRSRITLTGDDALLRRPMRRLEEPLGALGLSLGSTPDGTPPLVTGGAVLRGARVLVRIASAQVRTSFALAALQAEGSSSIDSPAGFRDHTERWLSTLGLGRWESRTAFQILPGSVPPGEYVIPADPSSAAFLWAAAALSPGSSVRTPGVSLNPGRSGFLEVMEQMGATVERRVTHLVLGDPVGDVTVVGAPLRGGHVGGVLAVRTIDELPLVAVLGGAAEGETRVTGAGDLRAKESDRIASVVDLMRTLGARAEATSDGFVVSGGEPFRSATARAHGDHRIAMAAAVAATAARGPVEVEGIEAAGISWPGFGEELEATWSSR